jgi:uncharacterized protein YjbK
MSVAGREIELKFALTDAAELEKLSAALGGTAGPTVEQINHFFDTAELDLHREKHVLRLREEDRSRYLVTAKGPGGSEDGALSERTELETNVDPSTAQAILEGSTSALSVLEQALGAEAPLLKNLRTLAGGKALNSVGKFENTRTPQGVSVDLGGGITRRVVFELDRTVFPNGRIDFEVEIELQAAEDEAERKRLAQAIRSLVEKAGISVRTAPSKAKRLFDALR